MSIDQAARLLCDLAKYGLRDAVLLHLEGLDILNAHGSTGYRRAADQSDPGFRQQNPHFKGAGGKHFLPGPFIFATDPLVESLSVADMDEKFHL